MRTTDRPRLAAPLGVLEAQGRRRAVKHFEPGHRLTPEELRELLRAAALAPTSYNLQNRHLVVVEDPALRERLRRACFGQEQITTASAVLVLTGDLRAHENTARTLRNAPADVRELLAGMVRERYADDAAARRDEALRTAGLTGMNLMLAAQALGYASCPMVGFEPRRVSELLGLDADHPPLLIVAVGRAARPAHGRLGLLDLEEWVSVDRLGSPGPTGSVDPDAEA